MTHRYDLPLAIELIDKNDYNNSFEFVREILIKTKAFFSLLLSALSHSSAYESINRMDRFHSTQIHAKHLNGTI